MNIKDNFAQWLIDNRKVKNEARQKELMALFEQVDESWVRVQEDGQYSLFDYKGIKAVEYIFKNFLRTKQVNGVLGKNSKLFNKNKDQFMEFCKTLPAEIPQENRAENDDSAEMSEVENETPFAVEEPEDGVPEDSETVSLDAAVTEEKYENAEDTSQNATAVENVTAAESYPTDVNDIKDRFAQWLIDNHKVKNETKQKELMALFEQVDENCVRAKGDGQYSLFDYKGIKTVEFIFKNFLITKQVNGVLGKNSKLFNKHKDQFMEFCKTLPPEILKADSGKESVKEKAEISENEEMDDTVSEEAEAMPEEAPSMERLLVRRIGDITEIICKDVNLLAENPVLNTDEEVSVYFDPINSQMGIDRGGYIERRETVGIYSENGKVYEKNENIFLGEQQEKLFVYDDIFSGKPSGDIKIIEETFRHSLADYRLAYQGVYAMLPDVLDDFAKETRAQLVYKGERIFPIPRSIAHALGRQRVYRKSGKDFSAESTVIFADFDGNEFAAIHLDVEKDKETEYSIFIRKGLMRVSSKHSYNDYNTLFDVCVKEYSQSYGIKLDEKTKEELKASKAFATLFSTKKSILLRQSNGYVRLDYDKRIHNKIVTMIDNDVKALEAQLLGSKKQYEIIIGSCMYGTGNEEFIGCKEVRERIKENRPLWKEYLPELSLEVIKDGRYGELKLIEANQSRDVLKTLGEEEIIPIDGTLTFAEGKEYYSLPLEREIENDVNKEKQSVFRHPSFPLKKAVSVSLEIRYKYGDENSYKLVAKPIDSKNAPFDKVESEWTDRDQLPLGKVSKFVSTGGMLPRRNEKYNDIENINKAFNNFSVRLDKSYNDYDKSWRRQLVDTVDRNGNKSIPSFLYDLRKYFASRRRVFNNDSYNKDKEAREFIDKVVRSQALVDLIEIAKGNEGSGHRNHFESLVGPEKARAIRDIAQEIVADLSVVYEMFPENPRISDIADFFIKLRKIRHLSLMSRCLTEDEYGVYEAISGKIVKADVDKGRMRSIASNCNYISNWASNLYHTENGEEALEMLRDKVIEVIMASRLSTNDNPLEVRDYMELLVCLCTVNEIDESFIDPNNPKIKKLVKKLKQIDEIVFENKGKFYPKIKGQITEKKFVCRLQTQEMDKKELYGMHDLTFMLVQILTGAQDINLTGFEDDGES